MRESGRCSTTVGGGRPQSFVAKYESGERAAAIYTLIATAKLHDIDPEAWLADVFHRISDHRASRLDELPAGRGNGGHPAHL